MATITTTEFAAELNTTPRTARKFLRADAADRDIKTPGKGSRYAIERKDLKGLKSRFAKWDAARTAPEDADAPEVEVKDESEAISE